MQSQSLGARGTATGNEQPDPETEPASQSAEAEPASPAAREPRPLVDSDRYLVSKPVAHSVCAAPPVALVLILSHASSTTRTADTARTSLCSTLCSMLRIVPCLPMPAQALYAGALRPHATRHAWRRCSATRRRPHCTRHSWRGVSPRRPSAPPPSPSLGCTRSGRIG